VRKSPVQISEINLFLVLVDVLSGLTFYVPVGTIAMILLREGLKRLCGILVKPKKPKN
jgi:hypothetical protein